MSRQSIPDHKQSNQSRNRLLPWLVFVSLLLVIATAILLMLIKNHAEAARGSDFPLGANAISGFDCDYSEAQRIYPFGDGLLKVTATRIVYMSVSGKEIYAHDMKMEEPYCVVRGAYALVADQAGFSYVCLNNYGMLYSGSVAGQIGYADISFNGYGALIFEEENTNGAVCIMNSTGEKIAQWNSVESGYPVSVSFSPKSSLLSIALIDTDSSHMQPNLKQIFIPDPSSGEKPYDFSFVSSDDSSILPMISHMSEEQLLWSGISRIYSLSQGILTEVPASFPNINTLVSLNGKTGVFYSEGVGQQILFSCIEPSLSVSSPIVLGNQLKAHSAFGRLVLIAVDNKLLLIDADTCTIKKERAVDEDIIRVLLSSKDRAVIVTSSGVREIRF